VRSGGRRAGLGAEQEDSERLEPAGHGVQRVAVAFREGDRVVDVAPRQGSVHGVVVPGDRDGRALKLLVAPVE
jgi:hypothetical protein